MKKYEVWGYIGNPCEYKIRYKIVYAENSNDAIKKSRFRNITQVKICE